MQGNINRIAVKKKPKQKKILKIVNFHVFYKILLKSIKAMANMYWITTTERVKLNYAMCTVAAIIVYTFFVQFVPQKLWLSVMFFIIAECLKVFIVQKLYILDTANNIDAMAKRRRNNKVIESLKFGFVMSFTVFFFAFICIILGGKIAYYSVVFCKI